MKRNTKTAKQVTKAPSLTQRATDRHFARLWVGVLKLIPEGYPG